MFGVVPNDNRASTAIEFALVALPFFGMILAILEAGLLFVTQEVLNSATAEAARLVLTGQAQTQGMTSAQFRQFICDRGAPLISCSNLYVDVQSFSAFGSVMGAMPLQSGQLDPSKLTYKLGGANDIVMVQAFYKWPVLLSAIGFNLANLDGQYRLLVSTSIFRDEPF